MKKILSCLQEYKRFSYLTIICVVCESILEIFIPLCMSLIIDRGITPQNTSEIIKYGLFTALLAILALIIGSAAGKYAAIASTGLSKNIRNRMFANVQDFSFSSIDKFSTSSLVTRLTTDITNVQNAFQMLIRIMIKSPVMLISAIFMTIYINPSIAFIFAIAVPILAIGLFFITTKAHPIFEKVFRTYDRLNNTVQEDLHGMRVVKSYVREAFEITKFKKISQSIYTNFTKAEKLLAFNTPLMQFSMYLCMLLLSWVGAQLIIDSTMTTGQLVSVFSYTMQILMSLMMLSMVLVMFTISRASIERIGEVLDEESDLKNNENPIQAVPNGSVRFDNVTFKYADSDQHAALSNINLEITAGDVVGIIGGTGSSKSTLVQLIPRLYDTTAGTVSVGDIDVKNYDLTTLRDNVAMVLQQNVLFSGTIKENLRWGNPDATDEELIAVCKQAQAHDFIQEFENGYDTYIEQGGSNVSGGQKQRLCIARALLKTPKILILDDSTSAVDTKTDFLIRESLKENWPNTTVFIVAQRISSVEHANKIIVMENGKINGFGTHEELLVSNTIYREIDDSQKKGFGNFEEAK